LFCRHMHLAVPTRCYQLHKSPATSLKLASEAVPCKQPVELNDSVVIGVPLLRCRRTHLVVPNHCCQPHRSPGVAVCNWLPTL
jgi:hypothetical protein